MASFSYSQCCDLEAIVSRLECTRTHLVHVLVLVSRPEKASTATLAVSRETWKSRENKTKAVWLFLLFWTAHQIL